MINSLNFLDIILIIIVFLSILFGVIKGLIRELFSLAFFIIAVVLSFLFYHDIGNLFLRPLKSRDAANFAGFISIFALVLIIGSLITYIVKKIFTLGPLKAIDMILGGVFGLLRGLLISSIIVFALLVFPVNDKVVVQSYFSPYVMKTIEIFVNFLPGKYKRAIQAIKMN